MGKTETVGWWLLLRKSRSPMAIRACAAFREGGMESGTGTFPLLSRAIYHSGLLLRVDVVHSAEEIVLLLVVVVMGTVANEAGHGWRS